ncbi:uncharacterized protein OCT59_012730 [Rhizophagus irregularis]|uniref:F-box domain-containing protein n=2 Tax=Rhizophagus irregularis TaxID=588596 RepID=A0A015II81_RHIIW|nr:hypothetical protein RirG_240910 [Rhizophagus irregularis DAOM 197198w]UZO20304.1 hypothetical protein OCT59_012730 [Rhizophagus irregularis]
MSKLNKDILFLIFEEFQYDSKSLFSCLMVNRFWCETVIPILWRNPWCYDIKYYDKDYLFIIIASYLSDDIKEFLKRLGIQKPLVSRKSLLFDYLSFCRNVDINVLSSIISTGSSSTNHQLFLQQEFCVVFMKNCQELKYFDMRSLKHQIFHFPEAKLCFESLYELKCDTSIDVSYFYGLARICQHIQKLMIINITNEESNLGIVKLIEVQKNLRHFAWVDFFDGYISKVDPYKEILLALEKKADTIDYLGIYLECLDHTLQKVLPKFHKIKTLITSFRNFSEEQLKVCVYHDLEIFKIDYYDLKAASIIIENSGGRLKKFFLVSYELDDYVDDFEKDSLIFIRKVYENCPLIEYLSHAFTPSKKHLSEFENLLKVCQNLKLLTLILCDMERVITGDENILEIGEDLLKVLARSAPTSLREIRFLYGFKFSLEALEEFLEKWRGRPAITILTIDPIYKGENYKNLINKYKDNGVIKDFRCDYFINLINILNMDPIY